MIRSMSFGIAVALLAGCSGLVDVARYETGVTRVRPDTPEPANLVANAVPENLAASLQSAGFLAYLSQTGGSRPVEWYTLSQTAEEPVAIKSISKLLVTAALGDAVAKGQVSLTTPLDQIDGCAVPQDFQPLSPQTLANMGAGFAYSENNSPAVMAQTGWACRILGLPVQATSGTRFNYGTVQTHLLGLHLSDVTGQPLNQIVQDRVLTPMGITLDGWTVNQDGDVMGGSEMWLHPRDMLSIGTAFRDNGQLNGQQVLSQATVARSRDIVFADTGRAGIGYGWGWWHTTLADTAVQFGEGYGGQIIAIALATDQVFVFAAPTGGWVSDKTHDARIRAALGIIGEQIRAVK